MPFAHHLAAFLLVVSSCLVGSARAQDTPETLHPDADTAVLSGDDRTVELPGWLGGKVTQRTGILRLDGENMGSGFLKHKAARQVRLSPGRHTVQVHYEFGNNEYSLADFWLDAQAGKSYVIRFEDAGTGLRMWIEDAGTHGAVGGYGDGRLQGVTTSSGAIESVTAGSQEAPADQGSVGTASKRKARRPPPTPDAHSAVLVCDPGNDATLTGFKKVMHRIQITRLDGTKQYHPSNLYQSFRLAPGKHRIVVWSQSGGGHRVVGIEFEAQVGKAYWVRELAEGYGTRIWVENVTDGEPVGVEFDAGDYPY
jgi:hypothetical protein